MTIAIIGTGLVGSTIAYTLLLRHLVSEIILVDVNHDKAEGEALDIANSLAVARTGSIRAGAMTDAATADVIIIAAGLARMPEGGSRLDLLKKNAEIVASIFSDIGSLRPETIVIMVTNPVDALTYIAQEISHLPHSQVFGTGTVLDTNRLKQHLAETLAVAPQSVHGYVIGEHGDSGFVAWSTVTVGGVAPRSFRALTSKAKRTIEEMVRTEAYRIIQKKNATYYGIAAATSDIVEAIVYDEHRLLPVSSRLKNWNGISGMCLGAPVVIGRRGIEKLWPISLSFTERAKLKKSALALAAALKPIQI